MHSLMRCNNMMILAFDDKGFLQLPIVKEYLPGGHKLAKFDCAVSKAVWNQLNIVLSRALKSFAKI